MSQQTEMPGVGAGRPVPVLRRRSSEGRVRLLGPLRHPIFAHGALTTPFAPVETAKVLVAAKSRGRDEDGPLTPPWTDHPPYLARSWLGTAPSLPVQIVCNLKRVDTITGFGFRYLNSKASEEGG